MGANDYDILRLKGIILKRCRKENLLSESVIEDISSSLLKVIRPCWEIDYSSVFSLFTQLGSYLREDCSSHEDQENMKINLISVVLRVSHSLGDEMIADLLAKTFKECLTRDGLSCGNELTLKLIEGLALVSTHCSVHAFEDATKFLISLYRCVCRIETSLCSKFIPIEKDLKIALPLAFLKMADNHSSLEFQRQLFLELLNLFSELGLAMENSIYSTGAALMGPLLPSVAALMHSVFSGVEFASRPEQPEFSPLLRNLWFYLSLYGLIPWPSASRAQSLESSWVSAVESIALVTPPLVMAEGQGWQYLEHQLQALFQPGSGSNPTEANRQRDRLRAVLQFQAGAGVKLSTMSGAKATFLLSVAALECLRARSGGIIGPQSHPFSSLQCAFSYLEQSSLTAAEIECLERVVEQSYDTSASTASDLGWTASLHAQFLVPCLGNPSSLVRQLAAKLLSKVQLECPQIQLYSACLVAWMSLLHSHPLLETPPHIITAVRQWCWNGFRLAPPTFSGMLQEVVRTSAAGPVSSLLWALTSAPQDQRLSLDRASTAQASTGTMRAQIVCSSHVLDAAAATVSMTSEASRGLDLVSCIVPCVAVKSRYMGQVEGMLAAATEAASARADQLPASFAMLVSLAEAALDKCVRPGASVDPVQFQQACLHAAALVLEMRTRGKQGKGGLKPGMESGLLRRLCQAPAKLLSEHSVRTGIQVWSWILSWEEKEQWRLHTLLPLLVRAWTLSRHLKKGLFASHDVCPTLRPHLIPSAAPGAHTPWLPGHPTSAKLASSEQRLMDEIQGHKLWLGFLLDRLLLPDSWSTSLGPSSLLLAELVVQSLSGLGSLCSHPAAGPSVFRLLVAGLQVHGDVRRQGQGEGQGKDVRTAFSRQKHFGGMVVRCALLWFSQGAGCFHWDWPASAAHKAALQSREPHSLLLLQAVEDFSHALRAQSGATQAEEPEVNLVLVLCSALVSKLGVWTTPVPTTSNSRMSSAGAEPTDWASLVACALSVSPNLPLALVEFFPHSSSLLLHTCRLIQSEPARLYTAPEAIAVLASACASNPSLLSADVGESAGAATAVRHWLAPHLQYWAHCSILTALSLLTSEWQKADAAFPLFSVAVLESCPPQAVSFFLPQLVQALRYDSQGLVEDYLVEEGQKSNQFAHRLIWQLQGEGAPSEEDSSSLEQAPVEQSADELWSIVPRVREHVITGFSREAHQLYLQEFHFFDAVTSISGALKPIPKEKRRAAIRPLLEAVQLEGSQVYLPTEPHLLVRGILLSSGVPLQSAKKVPIKVTFEVVPEDKPLAQPTPQACIFKVGDDCRQDVLALQVISLLRDINRAAGLELFLFPYGVLPTGYERGIIEVVPNTRSRNQIGEMTDSGLLQAFVQEYGAQGSKSFESARTCFIQSSAGYAVASLLLQPKDRHNGNLLIDRDGHLVHIDFGFILETSPGGNLRFESADFKLSHEMAQIIDPSGAMQSEHWSRFVSLCVKGYLAARAHMESILSAVRLMLDSGLPCFSRGDPIGNLRRRFHPEMNDVEAAAFMRKTCTEAYNKWTTAGYDLIQYLQQGIEK